MTHVEANSACLAMNSNRHIIIMIVVRVNNNATNELYDYRSHKQLVVN